MRNNPKKELLFTLAALTAASPYAIAGITENQEQNTATEIPSAEKQMPSPPASTIMTLGEIVVSGKQDNPAVDLPGSVDAH